MHRHFDRWLNETRLTGGSVVNTPHEWIPAAVSTIAGLFGASSAEKEAAKLAKRKEQLAAPWYDAGKMGLSGLQRYTSAYLLPRVGAESPLLAYQHDLGVNDINQGRDKALAGSYAHWLPYNTGRGRGEELRINQGYDESLHNANLAYGQAQQGFKDTNANNYASTLGTLSGFGGPGLQTNLDSIDMRMMGQQSGAKMLASTLAALGSYYGTKAGENGATASVGAGGNTSGQPWFNLRPPGNGLWDNPPQDVPGSSGLGYFGQPRNYARASALHF